MLIIKDIVCLIVLVFNWAAFTCCQARKALKFSFFPPRVHSRGISLTAPDALWWPCTGSLRWLQDATFLTTSSYLQDVWMASHAGRETWSVWHYWDNLHGLTLFICLCMRERFARSVCYNCPCFISGEMHTGPQQLFWQKYFSLGMRLVACVSWWKLVSGCSLTAVQESTAPPSRHRYSGCVCR